jgi:putative ABC transport system permease protein
MEIGPIFSALTRNKVGALLIALQVALTLAIVCNALFIINQRMAFIARPSGVAEDNVFLIKNLWVGRGTSQENKSLLETDIQTLRTLPDVVDAYPTNTMPLTNGGWSDGVNLSADQEHSTTQTAEYMVDDHTINTLGLKLLAGRNFRPEEITDRDANDTGVSDVTIVTQQLAEKMFPDGSALGKAIYVSKKPTTIIGIIENLQVPWVGSWVKGFDYTSAFVPQHSTTRNSTYAVRAKPGELETTMKAAETKLLAINPLRVIGAVRPMSEVRAKAYRGDRAMAILLSIVCGSLLIITALGIVGLASFWVTQRRKQIGTRRALGATRMNIVSYFLTENLLISMAGVALGIVLAVSLNLWLVNNFELTRLTWWYLPMGAVMILLLGQAAVLPPARRAASVPPAVATRSA